MTNIQSVKGYYHKQIGDYRVTALFEGINYLSPDMFKNLDETQKTKILTKYGILDKRGIPNSLSAFVVDDGKSLTLIDSGYGGDFSSSKESAIKNFELAGYKFEDVKTILLTHLHPDHFSGITKNGFALFPNATVYVHKDEVDFWLNPATKQTIPEDKKEHFSSTVQHIKTAFEPYEKKQALKIFEKEKMIQGFEVIDTSGHTPGHRSYRLTTNGQSIVFVGDIMHSHSLQFDAPRTVVDFDIQSRQALNSRLTMFEELSKTQDWVAGVHLPFPAIGHIYKVNDEQYQWIPVYFDNSLGE